MTDFLLFIGIFASIGGIIVLAIAGARYDIDGNWHRRYQHKCLYHSRYRRSGNPCPSCGKTDGDWREGTARATFLFGWEWRG